jgi:hypothetical protein
VATNYPVPTERALQSLFADLAAVDAKVARADVADPPRDATGVFAEYVTDEGELAVLGYADARAANSIGGALVDIPEASITEANESQVLLDGSLEGFQEVLNILSSCLNSEYTRHLKLRAMRRLPGQIDDDVKQLWRNPRGRRAYRIDVEDHGSGSLILYIG